MKKTKRDPEEHYGEKQGHDAERGRQKCGTQSRANRPGKSERDRLIGKTAEYLLPLLQCDNRADEKHPRTGQTIEST